MKIYSLIIVKNEADIVASTLTAAAQWSDKIIVIDNGSTDGTWEQVQKLARKFDNIVPFAQECGPYHIGLRARMFNAYKDEMTDNDWWCFRLDADEFYIDNPKEFLKNIPKRYKLVWKKSFDYKITYEDLKEYKFGENFEDNKAFIKYYEPYTWAEGRFLRHSNKLVWGEHEKAPARRGLTYPKQIGVKHYQYRSPAQMNQRYLVRQKAKADGCGSFKHEKGSDWHDYLKSRADLIKEGELGQMTSLGSRNHFNRFFTRVSKWILTICQYY